MYIFADSGATKTRWLITDSSGTILKEFKSLGLNPYFWNSRDIFDEIKKNFPEDEQEISVEKVFFYGAGCENHDKYQSLSDALETFFPVAIIYIYSDMLGAARALFNNKEGIAAILGTGSNSCVFNGHTVYRKTVTLGYILGDEGSGAHIGKLFIKKYLEGGFNEELTDKIKLETGATIETVKERIYSKPQPNKYLASFCNFVNDNLKEPEILNIVENTFRDFFKMHIKPFPESKYLPVSFCGSVAFYFKDVLSKIANENNIKISQIIQDPLEGIIEYHKEKGFF